MFKKKLNLIFIGIILIFFGFLISILSIDTVRSQIAQKVGITVAQSPIRWNDAKDVAAGATAQTSGIPMSGLYGYNGTNWNGLLTSTHGDNLTTATGLNTGSFLYAFDGVNWDRVRATGLTDANATAAGVGMAAFPLMWNGASWDLVRGTIANGLLVNVSALPAIVGNVTPADAYANPANAVGTWSLIGAYNGATWDRLLKSTHGDALATASGLNTASIGYLFNGATYDRIRGDMTYGLDVDITRSAITPVYTTTSPGITTAQIAVGAGVGGTLIRAINLNRRSIIIRNQDAAVDMYVGVNGVTIVTGLLVKAGESITLDRNTAAIYGITAAANIVVGYLEE